MKKKVDQLADMSLVPIVMLMQALLVTGVMAIVATGLLCFWRVQ